MSRKPKPKLARARTILTNYIGREGVLPNRQAGMKLLINRIGDITRAQASNYYNRIKNETGAKVEAA